MNKEFGHPPLNCTLCHQFYLVSDWAISGCHQFYNIVEYSPQVEIQLHPLCHIIPSCSEQVFLQMKKHSTAENACQVWQTLPQALTNLDTSENQWMTTTCTNIQGHTSDLNWSASAVGLSLNGARPSSDSSASSWLSCQYSEPELVDSRSLSMSVLAAWVAVSADRW